jgi:hypothetical protein
MRRNLLLAPIGLAALLFLTPIHRIIHPQIDSPLLHAALDVLTLAALTAPLWTLAFWGPGHRAQLGALIGIVQLPAVALGMWPGGDFAVRLAILVFAVGLSWVTLGFHRIAVARPPRKPKPARAAVLARQPRIAGRATPITR